MMHATAASSAMRFPIRHDVSRLTDGDLYLFANDAAFLFDYATYYANNRGTAEVSMSDLDARAIAGTMAKSAGEAGADDSAQTKD